MEKYQAGDVLYYLEGDMVLKVKVLENKSNEEWDRYKLQVLRVVKEAQVAGAQQLKNVGLSLHKDSIFSCEKTKEKIIGCSPIEHSQIMWHLLSKEKSEALTNALKKDKKATLVWI